MKKFLILSFSLVLCFSAVNGQTINGNPIQDIDTEYIRIVGFSKLLSNKVTIQIDFGQQDKIWKMKDTQLLDKDGKPVVLNSMVAALNFMSENGYEFVQAYAFVISNQNVYHYLMRKQKKE